MKLAIIQAFEGHFELLGFILEYCISRNIYFEIFTWYETSCNTMGGPLNEGSVWKDVFNKVFSKHELVWKTLEEYNKDDFTRTINLTSFNTKFNFDVTVAHDISEKVPGCINIGVRKSICHPCILPVYNGITKEEKILVRSKRVSVIVLGQTNTCTPIQILYKLFKNFDDIDFYYINRFLQLQKVIPSNVYNRVNLSASELTQLFKQSHYFFCLDHPTFENDKMSCSVIHALSYGSRLIVPKDWDYDLKNCIRYDLGKIDESRMTLKVLPVEPVFEETQTYIERNNCVLDKVFSNFFLEVCAFIQRTPPRVFVETGTYKGDGIENVLDIFEEIHSIELNEEFVHNVRNRFKNKQVYVHHGDSSQVLAKFVFQEPVLFYLDAHFSGGETAFGPQEDNGCPLLRELAVLGKRTEDDIVIIDDMRLMGKTSWGGMENDELYPLTLYNFEHVTFETILNAYGRSCKYYMIGDRLVLHS